MALQTSELGGAMAGIGVAGAIAGLCAYVVDKTKSTLAVTGNSSTNPDGYMVNQTFDASVSAVKEGTSWLSIITVALFGGIAIGLVVNSLRA